MKSIAIISLLLLVGNYSFGQNENKAKIQIEYHNNGIVKSNGHTIQNKKNAEWTYWDEDGKLTKIENYTIGKLNGTYAEYYSNGNIKLKGSYLINSDEKSIKDGYWFYYNEKGELIKQLYYLDGFEYENKLNN